MPPLRTPLTAAPRHQLAFISFALIINTKLVTRFDFYKEIESENVAAGLLLGLEFIAVGYLMSNSTVKVRERFRAPGTLLAAAASFPGACQPRRRR